MITSKTALVRTLFGGAAGLLSLLLPGCFTKPFDPILPRWDVPLTAPISVRNYTLSELAERQPEILTPGTGNELVYHANASTIPTGLGQIFSLAPLQQTTSAHLGPIGVGAITPFTAPVAVPGGAAGLPLPPLTRVSLPAVGVSFSHFVELEIVSGLLTITVRNNLPVALSIDSTLTLRNSSGVTIATFTFPAGTIPASGSASATADLGGVTATASLSIANICISTSQGVASLPAGDLLVATLTSTPIVVARAVLSTVPPQRLVDNDRFSLPVRDSSRVREVRIASGTLTLDVTSAVGMTMSMQARFPQLLTAQGTAYTDSFYLGPNASMRRVIPLAGLRLRSTTAGFINDVEVITTVDLFEGSRGLPVTVSRDDSVRIQIASSTLVVDQVVGIVKPTVVAIDQKFGLEFGTLARKLQGEILIPSAGLTLTPASALDMPVGINLTVRARDGQGRNVDLAVPVTKTSGFFAPIVFDPAAVGAFLSRISGHLPDTLQLVGTIVLNPDYDTTRIATVGSATTVGGAVDLAVPLRLAIVGGALADTVAVGDTTGDGSRDAEPGSDFYDNVERGRIHVELDNGLPLRSAFSVTFLDRDRRPLLTIPQGAGDSLNIAPAGVSGGTVVSPARSSRIIEVSGGEVQLLKRAIYLRYGMGLGTPGPGPVSFRSTDGVNIRIWSEMTYQVEP